MNLHNANFRTFLHRTTLGLLCAIPWLPAATGHAQPTIVPFDSTWYGFNTALGSEVYFLSSAQLADVDNDGDSDVVGSKAAINDGSGPNGFVVLKNNGSGLYNGTPVHYALSRACGFVAVADLNNDGFKDVVASNTGASNQGNSISVFFNQGNGTFGSVTPYTVGGGPEGIAAADFNRDGNVDLAVTNYGGGLGNSLSVLMNTGGGVFGPPVTYPAGDAPYRIVAARVNADTSYDLVVAGGWVNGGATVNVLLNAGNGTFSSRTEYAANGRATFPSVSVTDIDNDGDNDVLFPFFDFNTGAMIDLYRNQGNGTFSPAVAIQMDPNTVLTDITCADLNGDGWRDIVAASASARTTDGYEVAMNNGSGNFTFSYRHPAGANTLGVMAGDVDGDGLVDILTADSYSMQITVHRNFGGGLFPLPHLDPLGGTHAAGSIDAADIDGDGLRDIVTSASGRAAVGVPVQIEKNLGNGIFGSPITYSIRGGGVQAKFRDLNGDSLPDLLFGTAIDSPPYDFHYAMNLGNGTFGSIQTKPIGACGWYDIDAVDLNNDGRRDVVITEPYGCQNVPESARRVFICLNNGDGTFADPIIKLVGPHPSPVAAGDFNRDGNLDLVSGVSGGAVEIYLGTGTGDVFPPAQFSIGGIGAEDLAVADFNNDGKLDIAASNIVDAGAYGMSLLFGNGDGTFQPAVIFPSQHTPDLLNVSGITVGDVDNDGDKDIMVANYESNSLSLYINDNGTFAYSPMRIGIYWGVYSPFFADFDNDGKGDLVAVGNVPPFGIFSTVLFLRGKNTGVTSVPGIKTDRLDRFLLSQNFPNPFNPTTTIEYHVASPSPVEINVYDVLGEEVSTLVEGQSNPGTYRVRFDAAGLASGVYFYRLKAEELIETRRMVVIK